MGVLFVCPVRQIKLILSKINQFIFSKSIELIYRLAEFIVNIDKLFLTYECFNIKFSLFVRHYYYFAYDDACNRYSTNII